jgi:hypothetical protein
MAKPLNKALKRLKARQEDYDKLPVGDKAERRRPGSMKKKAKPVSVGGKRR